MFSIFKRAATKKQSWPYTHELMAMITLALTFFLAVSLLSYNPTDNSWFYFDTLHASTTNWCGYMGACLAGTLFYLFGSASIIFIFFSLFIFHLLVRKKIVAYEWDRIISYSVLLITVAGLLTIHEIDFLRSEVAGGYVGRLFIVAIYHWLDDVGTFILLYTLLLASLIIIFRFSFIGFACWAINNFRVKLLYVYGVRPLVYAMKVVYLIGKKSIRNIYRWCKKTIFSKRPERPQESFKYEQETHRHDEIDSLYNRSSWQELAKPAKTTTIKQEVPSPQTNMQAQKIASPDSTELFIEENETLQEVMPAYQLPQLDMFIGVDEEQNDQALMQ